MDILYYSNYCKHSQTLIQTLVKGSLADKLSFVNIDKRKRDPKTNQVYIVLENGSQVMLPPNINSVPSLLLIKQQYRVICGSEDILKHFHPQLKLMNDIATKQNSEPVGFALGLAAAPIVSEQFTLYNMTPDELSAKGKGSSRQLYNYVSAADELQLIETPPETYKPDKVSTSVTIDTLQQKRLDDIRPTAVGI
jgi:hypothetical protein